MKLRDEHYFDSMDKETEFQYATLPRIHSQQDTLEIQIEACL